MTVRGGMVTGPPRRIVIEQLSDRLWKFEVVTEDYEVIDYSLASTRGLAWGMAKRAWRHARRAVRRAT